MDTPQLSRIDSHARVSAAVRPDEAQAANGRGFATLLIGEDAAGRRRRRAAPSHDPTTDMIVALYASGDGAMEPDMEANSASDAEEVLPEDAHDPQELRALLAAPPG